MGPRDLNTPGLTGHMARVIARRDSALKKSGGNAKPRKTSGAPKRKGGRSRKDDD